MILSTLTIQTPGFRSGETLNTGVYFITRAGWFLGTITLDNQGDDNAIFVFKFDEAFAIAVK